MLLQIPDFHKSNEILYVLNSVHQAEQTSVSKIALQKLLYLSSALAPVKDIILSILKFQRIQRGPYSKEIQNIVDHLVAYGLVEISEFNVVYSKNSLAHYKITEGGIRAVEQLGKYSKENEKIWWIDSITRLSLTYSKLDFADGDDDFEGLDKIVRIVYQDLTFKEVKSTKGFRALIDFESEHGPTRLLIDFVKNYIAENSQYFNIANPRYEAELILTSFFDYFFNNYLKEYSHE
ncbi:hypothetical protein [Pedobacter agri]|uniref:hypothetical protein n=1 Tax=Pedobacter agri TaxID=454586 RepID=UPI0029308821|nr:hypothetical protein [Pedobacter agri]